MSLPPPSRHPPQARGAGRPHRPGLLQTVLLGVLLLGVLLTGLLSQAPLVAAPATMAAPQASAPRPQAADEVRDSGSFHRAKVRILGIPVITVASPVVAAAGGPDARQRARVIEGNLEFALPRPGGVHGGGRAG